MSDMYRRGGTSNFPDRLVAMRPLLGVLIAGTIALGVFAIPMKASRPSDGALAIHSLMRRLSTTDGIPVDLHQAAIRLIGLGRSFDWAADTLVFVGADGQRVTTERIRRFLARRGSPMTRYSRNIVTAGIRYHVDPRVVVAISGVESGYGIHSRGHNAWGWNGGKARWPSWETAIDRFTRAVGSKYRSLRTGRFGPASRTYCPPCGSRWGAKAAGIFATI